MKEPSVQYQVALFESVSHVMHAERILKEAHVPHKLIPVPRIISSDCGVCIRFLPEHSEVLENTLAGKVEGFEIRQL
ncbi:MAG: hypothetical protein C0392_07955 [Syntrophus sp. (in: bacteria)]|nr:hypothetical protein [Syntrophus sp. (in: bacteria)]